MFGVLAAYAWHSRATQTRAHSLIVVPWRPEIAFDTALCAAKSWLNRMRLVLQLGPGVITDPGSSGGQVRGYTFVPLLDRTEILAEARAMQNCADQYAERLADDRCRLFSIRREREHVATLEVGPHSREAGMLAITQLKGRHNMAAPLDVWQAAYAWLASQSGLRRLPPRIPPERQLDDERLAAAHGALSAPDGRRAMAAGDREPGGVRRLQCARWPISRAAAASRPGSSPSSTPSCGPHIGAVGVFARLAFQEAKLDKKPQGKTQPRLRRPQS